MAEKYLVHSTGFWKKHKYIAKVKVGKAWRYFYSQAAYNIYLAQQKYNEMISKNMYATSGSDYDQKIAQIANTPEWRSIVARRDPEYRRYDANGREYYDIDTYLAKKKHPELDIIEDFVSGRQITVNKITKDTLIAGLNEKVQAIGTLAFVASQAGLAASKVKQGTYSTSIDGAKSTASTYAKVGEDYINTATTAYSSSGAAAATAAVGTKFYNDNKESIDATVSKAVNAKVKEQAQKTAETYVKTKVSAALANTKEKSEEDEKVKHSDMTYYYIGENALAHHGILGMKWGIRRYQNEDGSLTSAGRRRYSTGEHLDELNDKQLRALNRRMKAVSENENINRERKNSAEAFEYAKKQQKIDAKQERINSKNRATELDLIKDRQKFDEKRYVDSQKAEKDKQKAAEKYAKDNSHRLMGKDITKLSDGELKLLNDRIAAEAAYKKSTAKPKTLGQKLVDTAKESAENAAKKVVQDNVSKIIGKKAADFIGKKADQKASDVSGGKEQKPKDKDAGKNSSGTTNNYYQYNFNNSDPRAQDRASAVDADYRDIGSSWVSSYNNVPYSSLQLTAGPDYTRDDRR